MTYVTPIGPLWLRALVVGAVALIVAISSATLALSPGTFPGALALDFALTSGFGALGILLIAYGSWRGLRDRGRT